MVFDGGQQEAGSRISGGGSILSLLGSGPLFQTEQMNERLSFVAFALILVRNRRERRSAPRCVSAVGGRPWRRGQTPFERLHLACYEAACQRYCHHQQETNDEDPHSGRAPPSMEENHDPSGPQELVLSDGRRAWMEKAETPPSLRGRRSASDHLGWKPLRKREKSLSDLLRTFLIHVWKNLQGFGWSYF